MSTDILGDAISLDATDELREFRAEFHLPAGPDGQPIVYLTGNSLGLQPRATAAYVQSELTSWAEHGVEGHFIGEHPWFGYHEFCAEAAAHVVGGLPHEVVMMNALTVNLHLMMVSFYRPTPSRYKILIEPGAFPSDQYAFETQARFHGFDPAMAVVEISATGDHGTITDGDIERAFALHGDTTAIVLMGGVNYLTGQAFDLQKITRLAHKHGAIAGFDLAHAAGNLHLELHDWNVDFAVWCSYKYLNSGPGGVAGAFVHDRHALDAQLPRFGGWWGNDPATRFAMKSGFIPQRGAPGWQLSNAPVLPLAAFRASGDIFLRATMPRLREKSVRLSRFLDNALHQECGSKIQMLTPRNPKERGCQISFMCNSDAGALQEQLMTRGVLVDVRRPNILRAAPVPLYNSFVDVARFAQTLAQVLP